jgi:hypothetical protein
MTIRKETLASLLFVGVGGGFAIASLQHPMGTAVSMGRGFFPFWVGAILAALGVLMLVRSLTDPGGDRLSVDLKPLVAITASILTFAALLPFAGLYVATVAAVLVASRADTSFGFRSAAALGLGLAVAAHLTFVAGIGLQLPLWPSFDL